MRISGATRLVGVLADPIHHVKAPEALNAALEKLGADVVVVPCHVPSAGLPKVLRAARSIRNLAGLLVTIPHKKAAVDHCDFLSESVRIAGAANVIGRCDNGQLHAWLTDGDGLLAALAANNITIHGRTVYLAGAGGAASAIAAALVAAGISRLTIANRSAARLHQLFERLRALPHRADVCAGDANPSGHEIIINATSLGLQPDDPTPLDLSKADAGSIVVDIVMTPTRLIAAAAARSLRTIPGRMILDHQLEQFVQRLNLVPLDRQSP